MPYPTREEFLSYVHQPLNRHGDGAGSPTKSVMRYQWRELRDWDVEADARDYWNQLPDTDKRAPVVTNAPHWASVADYFDNNRTPYTSEPRLRGPFETAYLNGHNRSIKGSGDEHAEMWTASTADAAGLDEPPVGNADFIFVYNAKVAGIVELKTWWKVDQTQIDDVKAGRGEKRDHHGRLAVEQAYGYMVHDKIIYGLISTFNAFVFLRRQSPGILYMSRLIPNNSTNPTIMKLLYFFSHLCARDPLPYPETNNEGIEIHLTKAPKDASPAPKIPNPENSFSRQTLSSNNVDLSPTAPRRSPRRHDAQDHSIAPMSSVYLDINSRGKGVYLGCKGWRGTLSTGLTVFAKLWDGWKFSREDCDHEASVYIHLRDLWGTIVPGFLGSGDWGFCHILLLSFIDCPMLYQVELNATISKNVVKAFRELHDRKVCHGDVRVENILVRPDNSVVVIDFERSILDAEETLLKEEMKEVKQLLTGLKGENKLSCDVGLNHVWN